MGRLVLVAVLFIGGYFLLASLGFLGLSMPMSSSTFEKTSQQASALPQSSSSENVKEYTAKDIKNVYKDPEPGQYMFGVKRPAGSEQLAWAELYFTPSQEGTGYFMESRATSLTDKGEFDTIEGHEMDLKWTEPGQEYRHTFWLAPVIEGRNDIFEIQLPEGSTWKLRIHPADHAPTVTGPVTSSTSEAFFYHPETSGQAKLAIHADTSDAYLDVLQFTAEEPTGDHLEEFAKTTQGSTKSVRLSPDKNSDTVPIGITSSGTSWVFTPRK